MQSPRDLCRPEAPARLAAALLIAIVGTAYGSTMANADTSGRLAPAGPCAEPREAVTGSAPSSFSVVGPLSQFFSPADVAAAPTLAARPAPVAAARVRPGPCDNPGAACGVAPLVSAPPVVGGGRPSPPPSPKPITGGKRP